MLVFLTFGNRVPCPQPRLQSGVHSSVFPRVQIAALTTEVVTASEGVKEAPVLFMCPHSGPTQATLLGTPRPHPSWTLHGPTYDMPTRDCNGLTYSGRSQGFELSDDSCDRAPGK